MKQGWEIKRLDDLCQIELGKTPYRADKSFWDTEKKTDNVWLSIADLLNTDGDVVSDSKEYITDKAAKISKVVKKGTLLLSFKLTLGRLAFAGRDLYTNEAIAALSIKDEKVIDKYFLYQFLSLYDWNAATEGDVKVKGKTLNKAKLKEIEVHFPKSLPEQQRIVSILDEAFAAIAKTKANAEQNLRNAKELFESYLQGVFEKKGVGWDETHLSEVCDFENGDRGKNYPNKSHRVSSGIPFINAGHLNENRLDFSDMDYISEERFNMLGNGKIKPNDILFCLRGSLGKVANVGNLDKGAIASSLVILRVKNELDNDFLLYFLNSNLTKKQIVDFGNGAAQPNLSAASLKKFIIPFPKSKEEQQTIVRQLDALRAETQKLEVVYQKKMDDLEELKKSILQKAFAGELKTSQEVV